MGEINKKGGFTYQPIHNKSPKKGFSVSVKDMMQFKKGEMTKEKFMEFFKKGEPILRQDPRNHMGGWLNTDNGEVYLDIAQVFDNQKQAEDVGNKTKQLKIFNLATKQEIAL